MNRKIPAAKRASLRAGRDGDATYHFNLATSHQAAARWDKARAHFTRAIELGMDYTSTVSALLERR